MGQPTSRKLQAEETRRRIQKAALDLFEKNGFDNVSMEDIAREAGCSAGNIYHYFRSKEALSMYVTDFVDNYYLSLEEEYLNDTTTPARQKLLDFVGKSLEYTTHDEALYNCFAYCMKYPEAGTLKINKDRVWYRFLHNMISDCKKEGTISEKYATGDIIEYFITLQRGTLFEWRIYEQTFDVAERGQHMATVLLNGLSE